jgi:hypothetical protein
MIKRFRHRVHGDTEITEKELSKKIFLRVLRASVFCVPQGYFLRGMLKEVVLNV